MFNETGVYVALRNNNSRKQNKFENFKKMTADFTFSSGWRVDKHIRYMVDVRKTGRADIIGFGDAGVFLSKNEPALAARTAVREAVRAAALAAGASEAQANAALDAAAAATTDALTAGASPIAASEAAGEAAESVAQASPAVAAAAGAAAALPRFKFTSPSIILHDFGYDQGWRLDKHLRFLVDFCGSGFPHIIGFGETSVVLVRNNRNGSFGARRDFDLGQFTYSSGWRVDKHVRTLADMSGKGRPDIVGFGNEGVYVAVNKGDGTVEKAKLVLEEFGYNQGWRVERDLRMIVDVDGNGLGDIVAFGRSGVYISKNRGNCRFELPKLVTRNFGNLAGYSIDRHQRFMVDVTSNGCADIVAFGQEEAYVAFNNGAGEFSPAQKFVNDFCWNQGWSPFTTVRYVDRLD